MMLSKGSSFSFDLRRKNGRILTKTSSGVSFLIVLKETYGSDRFRFFPRKTFRNGEKIGAEAIFKRT